MANTKASTGYAIYRNGVRVGTLRTYPLRMEASDPMLHELFEKHKRLGIMESVPRRFGGCLPDPRLRRLNSRPDVVQDFLDRIRRVREARFTYEPEPKHE